MPITPATLPNRSFGVEIEACGITRAAAASAIREAGIEATLESYNHQTRTHWKITTDASVEPGFEVVSPILRGEEGMEIMRTVVRAMANAGARVDRRCGIHVHVGIDDLAPNEVAAIVIRYARFETEIDAFMPLSRREDRNIHCHSIVGFGRELEQIGTFTNIRQVLRAQSMGRYVKVNLECYNRQRTIEFRQHSGSCNASKIENWIRFVLHFVSATQESVQSASGTSLQGSVTELVSRRHRRLRINSMDVKLDRVIVALRTAGRMGLTVREIAVLGGWSPNSVPVYISRIRSERGANIRKIRYTGRYQLRSGGVLTVEQSAGTTTRRAARGVTLRADDTLYRGIPAEVAGYYAERTSELSGNA